MPDATDVIKTVCELLNEQTHDNDDGHLPDIISRDVDVSKTYYFFEGIVDSISCRPRFICVKTLETHSNYIYMSRK